MAQEINIDELRRHLGIKKLKKKIPISEEEKRMIRQLREHDKRRVLQHQEKLKAS